MIRLDFNAAPIFRRLEQAQAVLGDLTPIHQEITDYMVEATKGRFRLGIDPGGAKWTPKKPATIERYKAKGDGDKPDPLIGPSGRLSKEIVGQSSPSASEIGSVLEYSSVMQHGAAQGAFGRSSRNTPIPWGTIPARVWLGISETDERNILDIVDENIRNVVDG